MKKEVNFIKRIAMLTAVTLIALTALLGSGQLFANNLGVSNLSYSQTNGTVTFTLSWEHSWRTSALAPNNWDAAWVFVKWRDCSAANTVQFSHGLVSTTVNDHSFGGTLEPTKKDGTSGIDASPDNTGVMLRNSADPASGTVTATVTLKLTNLPSTGSLDLRVYVLEMVFIPQGAFALGDGTGNPSTISYSSFATSTGGNTSGAIVNENAVDVYEGYPSQYGGYGVCDQGPCSLSAGFPKGYKPFYLMKYEISQGQYADFLNAIPFAAQNIHYPNNNGNNRQTITNTGNVPAIYIAGRPSRACNYLTWDDVSAYLDWAALRPMTELEYEKACRGPNPVISFETACGATGGTQAKAFSGAEDGTETITTFGANLHAAGWDFATAPLTSGDGVYGSSTGPIRCGIFATGSSMTRNQTGAGYYGNMELSGNVWEMCISARAGSTNIGSGPNANISTTGVSLGDGYLSASTSQANVTTWPLYNDPNNNYLMQYVIRRGGGYDSGFGYYPSSYPNVSARPAYCCGSSDSLPRESWYREGYYFNSGGRGAR